MVLICVSQIISNVEHLSLCLFGHLYVFSGEKKIVYTGLLSIFKLCFFFKYCVCQLQIGTCHGCLPSTSTRIKSCAAAVADLQHPLTELRMDSRNEAPVFPKTWHDRSSDS